MKLNFITIITEDLEASLRFYTELAGLHVVRRFSPGPQGDAVFLSDSEDATKIELIQLPQVEPAEATGLVLSFLCENLEEMREKAVSLGYAPSDIRSDARKPDSFIVPDPDGVIVEFGKAAK